MTPLKSPTCREPNYDAEMRLPEGKRCDDCQNARRCFGLGYSELGRTSCDFYPSRYRPSAEQSASAALAELSGRGG